jgi:hypothetical protein
MADLPKTISYPQADPVLTEKASLRKYLKYIGFFGPGAVVASLTIGQGQLILGPQIGAWAGLALLWLITINIGSYIIAYVSLRFSMLSGIGLMDLFAIKTKKGWFNWMLIIIMLIFIPIFAASIITTLGQSLAWIFGVGHYLIWGISMSLFAAILVLIGRYRLLEMSQAVFVAVLGIGAVISVLLLSPAPNLVEIGSNLLSIGQNIPESYPSWVDEVQGFQKTPISLAMLGYLGTLTFTMITLIGYLGWIKEKKWGIFKGSKDSQEFSETLLARFKSKGRITYLPTSKDEIKRSRLLMKPLLIDLVFAFIIVSIVSCSYMIAGDSLLGPQTDGSVLLPSDIDLLSEQGRIFSHMASWLEPLFKISVFFALFGTVYAGFEAGTRMLFETGKTIIPKINSMAYKRFMLFVLIYILALGIPLAILMFLGLSVLLMLSLTLMFLGVFGVIIYGAGSIYLSQKVLPDEYKLNTIGLIIALVGLALLMVPVLNLFI